MEKIDRSPITSKNSSNLASPFIVDKQLKRANWKKISKMISLARDKAEIESDAIQLESSNINSASGTKRFLARIEEDIGIKKLKLKPTFLKSQFKPDTMERYRGNGGVAPTNIQFD